ncbi:MAG: nucleotidyltransferase family protein [Candidatus Omnitrophota bacterium]
MKALILAAGYATRLYPLTANMPKPLLKLKNRAIIDYIMDKIEQVGDIDQITIITNNKFFGQFDEWLTPKKSYSPSRYHLINDGSNTVDDRLGAIGDINLAIKEAKIDDDLLIVGGDNLFDFNLNDFVRFGFDNRPYHSMCLYLPNSHVDVTKYGLAQISECAQIMSFEEKPKMPKSNLIATCIYYIPKEKLHLIGTYLNAGHYNDTPGSYMKWLVETDKVFGRICDGAWFDLGDFDAISEALIYLNGHATADKQ